MRALYRPTPSVPPVPCEILEVRADGFVCREVGRFWPGVFLAQRGQLQRDAAQAKPIEVIDPVAQRLLAKLHQAGVA